MARANELVITLFAALAVTACGEDGGGGASAEPVEDPQTIENGKTAAQGSAALAGIQAGADASTAQTPIATVGQSLQLFADRYRATTLQQQQGGLAAAGFALAALEQAQTAENTVTFENNHLSARIVITQPQATVNYDVELDMLPQDPAGLLFDGTFHLDFSVSQQGFNVTANYDAEYDGLKLDAQSCPIDGGLTVNYDFDLSGGILDQYPQAAEQYEQAYKGGLIRVKFGPNCGDVSAEGTR